MASTKEIIAGTVRVSPELRALALAVHESERRSGGKHSFSARTTFTVEGRAVKKPHGRFAPGKTLKPVDDSEAERSRLRLEILKRM